DQIAPHRAGVDTVGGSLRRWLDPRKRAGIANRDANGANLLSEAIRADDEHILGKRPAALEVVRCRESARDDVIEVAAELELLEAAQVVAPRSGRVVGGKEDVPPRAPQAVEGLLCVRKNLRAAVEDAVHVEDRDRHA